MIPQQYIACRAAQWKDDPRLADLITLAGEQTGAGFGAQRDTAIALRVLHMLAIEAQRGGTPGTGASSGSGHAGQVVSETEGSLSRTFSSGTKTKERFEYLSTTIYGQELIELSRGCNLFAITRMDDPNG